MPDQEQISWMTLEPGALVMSSDGQELGQLSLVIADEQKDIFSGITFRSNVFTKERFVPAEVVERITAAAVELSVPAAEAEAFEPYEV